jgi:hypothetical protein
LYWHVTIVENCYSVSLIGNEAVFPTHARKRYVCYSMKFSVACLWPRIPLKFDISGLNLLSLRATYKWRSRKDWRIRRSQWEKSRFYCLGHSSLGLLFWRITCKALWNLQTLKRQENKKIALKHVTWHYKICGIGNVHVSLSSVKYAFDTEHRTPAWNKTLTELYKSINMVHSLGYRSGGPGSIPGTTKFSEKKKISSGSETGSTQPRAYNWGATW